MPTLLIADHSKTSPMLLASAPGRLPGIEVVSVDDGPCVRRLRRTD